MRGYIIGRIASLCSRFIVSHWSIKLSKLSYWLPDLSGLRWMTSSDPDWIVTRGCWWRVQLRSRHQTLLSALADVNSSNNTERVCYLRNLASEHSKFGQQKINSWSQDSRLTWIEWIDIKYFRKNVLYIYYSFNHQHGQTGAQVDILFIFETEWIYAPGDIVPLMFISYHRETGLVTFPDSCVTRHLSGLTCLSLQQGMQNCSYITLWPLQL